MVDILAPANSPKFSFISRVDGSLRVTPAMAAGVTDHVWTLGELLGKMGSKSEVQHHAIFRPRTRRTP
jgi:hypothetical protein